MSGGGIDALSGFIDAMRLEGIKLIEPIGARLASGELIRFRCDGDKPGRQNGWAILYLDERPAGAFGNYRLGISRKWKIGADSSLTPEERKTMQREWAEAKERRAEERARTEVEAAKDALDLWLSAGPVVPDHAYAVAKRLDTANLRQSGDRILVPMLDAQGSLWNVQRILPDGTKRFLKGARTDGLFTLIGRFTRRGETACIGEGYATMAAVHRATGYPCIAAFSEKNLLAVSRLWSEARPDVHFIICADDDAHLIDNPNIRRNLGVDAAKAAAEAIGARYAKPLGRAA